MAYSDGSQTVEQFNKPGRGYDYLFAQDTLPCSFDGKDLK